MRSKTKHLPASTVALTAFIALGTPSGPVEALGPIAFAAPQASAGDSARFDSLRVDSTHFARSYNLPGITVSVARPALTTGGSSAVEVRLDSVAAAAAPTMESLLRDLPLLVVRRNSRGEAQPALRGSEDRQLGILMDGIPLTIGWDHRSDLSIVPLTAAQRVRVVRGMSSVLYGPNSLGGVIEVDVARVAGDLTDVRPLQTSLTWEGTGGMAASAVLGRMFPVGDNGLQLRAGAGFRNSPGMAVPSGAKEDSSLRNRYLTGPDDLRLNSDARRLDGFVSARYLSEGGLWASLAASGYGVERGVAPEAHQDGPRLWRYPEQSRSVVAVSLGSGVRTTPFGTGDFEASFGHDVSGTRIDAYQSERYATVIESEDADDRTLTARLEADHSLTSYGDLRSALTYADVRRDEVLTPGGSNAYRQRLWSLAFESEWRLGGRGNTRVSAGVAFDGSDTPESGDKPTLARLSEHGLRMGVSSLVGDGLLLHGAVSRRARFPSLRELYSGALGRFVPNPELRPERLVGAEAGFTLHKDLLELQAVTFHQRLRDGIVRGSVTGADGVRRFQRTNKDEVRSTGIEILLSGRVGVATVSSDFTLQQVRGIELDGSRVELEYEPATVGRLGVELPAGGGVRLDANARWMGGQSCENPEFGGLQPISASLTSDVSARRAFRTGYDGLGRVDVVVAVNNATDQISFDQCGLPQAGRTLELSLRLW